MGRFIIIITLLLLPLTCSSQIGSIYRELLGKDVTTIRRVMLDDGLTLDTGIHNEFFSLSYSTTDHNGYIVVCRFLFQRSKCVEIWQIRDINALENMIYHADNQFIRTVPDKYSWVVGLDDYTTLIITDVTANSFHIFMSTMNDKQKDYWDIIKKLQGL